MMCFEDWDRHLVDQSLQNFQNLLMIHLVLPKKKDRFQYRIILRTLLFPNPAAFQWLTCNHITRGFWSLESLWVLPYNHQNIWAPGLTSTYPQSWSGIATRGAAFDILHSMITERTPNNLKTILAGCSNSTARRSHVINNWWVW